MPQRIVVVEDRAHSPLGHFAHQAAILAEAFGELGCSVELMTVDGWVGESDPEPVPFTVTRAGRPTAALLRWAQSRGERTWGRPKGWTVRIVEAVTAVARSVGVASMVRTAVRRNGTDAGVVSACYMVGPFPAALLSGPGRILHHTFAPPRSPRPAPVVGAAVDGLVRRAEARRRARGGGLRIATGNPRLLEQWRARAPFLDPVLLPHAMARTVTRPIPDARERFGIPADARVALMYGASHPRKDIDTVWRAFADLPGWTLLVVGAVGDHPPAWVERPGAPVVVIRPGFVEEAERAAAFAAADVAVLSFRAGHVGESGVLADAVAAGVPVVCSADCQAALEVARFRLGELFPPGDAAGLAAALGRVPAQLDPEDLRAARAVSGAQAGARAHLDALAALDPRGAEPS